MERRKKSIPKIPSVNNCIKQIRHIWNEDEKNIQWEVKLSIKVVREFIKKEIQKQYK